MPTADDPLLPGALQAPAGPAAGYDELALLLRELAGRFGDTAFTDRRRLVSLLSDRLPDARRDIRVVGAAVDERVFDLLARARPDGLGMEVERLAAKLESGMGIRSDIAIPVVQACAYGLSLGPLPSVAGAAPLPPVPGAAKDDGWVGVSEPVRAAGAPAAKDDGWVGASEPVRAAAGPAKSGVWRKRLTWAGGAVATVFALLAYLGAHVEPDQPAAPRPVPQPTQAPMPQPAMPQPPRPQPVLQPATPIQPVPQPVPQPIPQSLPQPPPQQAQAYGNETYDFHVPPQSALKSDVGSPTPLTIPGATTVTTVQVMNEMQQHSRMVLVDSLQNPHQSTLSGAIHLPYSGQFGTFNDQVQAGLQNDLLRAVQGHREVPLVFFGLGVQCWESYNAALRARAAGFPNVFWYRGGLQAWQAAGFPMQPLQ